MQIHNFLCDLLSSLKLLFDTVYFPHQPGLIKSYQFNLGNRSFQLGRRPKSNYELPAVVATINDESIAFGGRRSDLIQQNTLENINKIPVLHNITQNRMLHVHEEFSAVSFSINLNCESQLQAKELAFQIKRISPLNKNLHYIKFISFLEIPYKILTEDLKFNTSDNIKNLFTKLNDNTNELEYCFSIQYNPIIRIESISTAIPDSSQSTYQINLEIMYHIQFPLYLVLEELNYIRTINLGWNVSGSAIVVQPFRYILGDDPKYKIDRTLILHSEDQKHLDSSFIKKNIESKEVYLNIRFDRNDFIIDDLYKFRFYKVNQYSSMMNILDNTEYNVPKFRYQSDNRVVFIFPEDIYNKHIKPEIISPLFIDFYYDLLTDHKSKTYTEYVQKIPMNISDGVIDIDEDIPDF